jgi:hypothetical protein
MANEIAVAPERMSAIQKYLAANPAMQAKLAAMQLAMTSGISVGGVPTIGCKSTRFVTKENGVTEPLVYPADYRVEELRGQPITTITAIVLAGKDGFDKAWYAVPYKDGEEPAAPDCFSNDGAKPDPSSALPRCTNCASCPQNAFGSGIDQNGDPGKGKACSDRKTLAILCPPKIWRLVLMPTALKGWKKYCTDLSAMGVFLPTAVTKITFDPTKNFPTYAFAFGGLLQDAQIDAVLPMIDGPEVHAIIHGTVPVASPVAQQQQTGPSAAELAAQKAEAEKVAKEAEKASKVEEKRKAAEAKKAAEAAKAAEAKPAGAGVLDIDFPMDIADKVIPQAANRPAATVSLADASEADIAALMQI